MRFGLVVAVVVAGLLAASPAYAEGTLNDLQNPGPREQVFVNYMVSHGFGYLEAWRVLSDGEVACNNDVHDVPADLNISMLTSRGYTQQEAEAIVAAVHLADNTAGSPPLC